MRLSTTLKSLVFIFISLVMTAGMVAQDEATAASLYNDGFALLKQKSYEEGLTLLEQALAKAQEEEKEDVIALAQKNGAVAAYNVGNTKRKAKSYDEALSFYNKGVELNPTNSSNYEGVARTLKAQGKKMEAVEAWITAGQKGMEEGSKRTEGRFKSARTMIGKMYVAKEYDNAIAAGMKYLEVKDDDPELHYYLGKSYGGNGDNATGLTHMNKAVELVGAEAPDKYLYSQGQLMEETGDKSGAIAAYKKITDEKYKAQADYRISELGG